MHFSFLPSLIQNSGVEARAHVRTCACRFTSDQKEGLVGASGVTITTYTMIAFSGKRSEESARVMDQIRSREWGLLLMDEVHVVPAQMFRKVLAALHQQDCNT